MKTQLEDLRTLAHEMLNTNIDTKTVSAKNFNHLIDELFIHQIELDLQHLNLIEVQTELEESRNKYANLYENAPIGYFILNAKGLITEVNAVGAELLGLKRDKLINRSFVRYVAPDSHYAYSEVCQRIHKTANQHYCEIKLLKRDGPLILVKLEGNLLKGTAPPENKILMMVTEISTSKQSEISPTYSQPQRYVLNIDKVSSTSELASLIAYELKHPLGVISNYIHGCIRQLESNDQNNNNLLKAMKVASTQLNRATEIILRMKNFICKNKLNHASTCINTLITEAISLIKDEAHDCNVNISFKPNKSIPKIIIDKQYIEQVILNLGRNAIEAMRDANTEDPKLIIRVNQPNIDTVEISIIDNGPGFCSKEMHKFFNSHYTTKAYGVGIGLAICRSIVESHGGELSAELNLTYGSCFKFTLPVKKEI